MRKPDEKLAQERRKQILDAAMSCFLKSGFHSTGMKEICAAANMSPGALYRYFESKDAIIQAITEQEQQEATEALNDLREARDFKAALLCFVEEFTREECLPANNVLTSEIFAESTRNPEVAKIMRKSEAAFLRDFQAVLGEAEADKRVSLKLTPEETARAILAVVYGISSLVLLGKKPSAKKSAMLARNVVENLIA